MEIYFQTVKSAYKISLFKEKRYRSSHIQNLQFFFRFDRTVNPFRVFGLINYAVVFKV